MSTGIVFAAAVNGSFNGYPIVNVTLNGDKVSSPVPAVVLNGSTMLPTRAIAESLNCVVKWDQATMTAKIIKPNVNMVFFYEQTAESDGSWNLTNVGCSNDTLGQDKYANFYIEVGPMDNTEYEYRIAAYDPSGKILSTSPSSSTVFNEEGTMIVTSIDNLTYSIPGEYVFRFQMKFDGEFKSVGEAIAKIE